MKAVGIIAVFSLRESLRRRVFLVVATLRPLSAVGCSLLRRVTRLKLDFLRNWHIHRGGLSQEV